MKPMKLVITVDTEEDNWEGYNRRSFTTKNIQSVPHLQELFDEFNIKPTYLITYPVATAAQSVSILKKTLDEGKCEIGAHCHPWSTPPFEEVKSKENSILCNLPPGLQYKKIETLHNAIRNSFGTEPVSFRAGRWAYDQNVAQNIYNIGYKIDTSVTPLMDWSKSRGPRFSKTLSKPYRFNTDAIFSEAQYGVMLEVPVTIDFVPKYKFLHKVFEKIIRNDAYEGHLSTIFLRLKMITKTWLSPELHNDWDMIKLTQKMISDGNSVINMTFHSSSLEPGNSPFVRNLMDRENLYSRIKNYLIFADQSGIESIRLCDLLDRA